MKTGRCSAHDPTAVSEFPVLRPALFHRAVGRAVCQDGIHRVPRGAEFDGIAAAVWMVFARFAQPSRAHVGLGRTAREIEALPWIHSAPTRRPARGADVG